MTRPAPQYAATPGMNHCRPAILCESPEQARRTVARYAGRKGVDRAHFLATYSGFTLKAGTGLRCRIYTTDNPANLPENLVRAAIDKLQLLHGMLIFLPGLERANYRWDAADDKIAAAYAWLQLKADLALQA